jgi:hypothetical protein
LLAKGALCIMSLMQTIQTQDHIHDWKQWPRTRAPHYPIWECTICEQRTTDVEKIYATANPTTRAIQDSDTKDG